MWTWVRLHDGFPRHPKVSGLSDAAFRLHVCAICYAGEYLTDGVVGAHVVATLVPRFRAKALEELLRNGLWTERDGDYEIHDFLEWNRSRAEAERRRQMRSTAGKKGAEARWNR